MTSEPKIGADQKYAEMLERYRSENHGLKIRLNDLLGRMGEREGDGAEAADEPEDPARLALEEELESKGRQLEELEGRLEEIRQVWKEFEAEYKAKDVQMSAKNRQMESLRLSVHSLHSELQHCKRDKEAKVQEAKAETEAVRAQLRWAEEALVEAQGRWETAVLPRTDAQTTTDLDKASLDALLERIRCLEAQLAEAAQDAAAKEEAVDQLSAALEQTKAQDAPKTEPEEVAVEQEREVRDITNLALAEGEAELATELGAAKENPPPPKAVDSVSGELRPVAKATPTRLHRQPLGPVPTDQPTSQTPSRPHHATPKTHRLSGLPQPKATGLRKPSGLKPLSSLNK